MVVVSATITTGGQETIYPGEVAPSSDADDKDEKVFLDYITAIVISYRNLQFLLDKCVDIE